nr:immunoglobulin heavy chain junction region [Macaca mulatta]MOW19608.1 immunoglobulin heavy chain junction region [Macaca mulatta]MOW19747.1 immunoglobulin heavy chain junction region [Macaca mulatta]MOW19912.1 immunoglobulin heavy chain junction region [Macaca mulatta]MOW20574.1 immunoglobulin heavy chain junction region [Macaca mulatta]
CASSPSGSWNYYFDYW